MRHNRDEYKWMRDAMVGQKSRNKPLPVHKKPVRLSDVLGVILVGVSLAFIALAMFR